MLVRQVRQLAVIMAVVLLAATFAPPLVPPAAASTGSVTIYGHGWGHGRGMGQFGAQGYATLYSWSAAQILNHFYGGTTSGSIAAGSVITVRLVAQDGSDLTVTSAADFKVAGTTYAAGQAVVARADSSGKYWVATKASCGAAAGSWVEVSGPIVFSSSVADPGTDLGKMLSICGGPTYRGELYLIWADNSARTVNRLLVEDYLRGVVPRESPSWFAAAALQAQAVAARSYGMAEGGENGSRYTYAKTCDTTSCQVYGGAGLNGQRRETTSTDAAVAATANAVRRFGNGSLARTEFSSSTGGWTAGGTFPAVIDEGDSVSSNPRHSWTATLQRADLESRYGLGTFVNINVVTRNGFGQWGGRVTKLQVVGTSNTATLTGEQFRADWGLYSTYFSTEPSSDTLVGPAVVSPTSGRLETVAVGASGAVSHRTSTAASSGSWATVGGVVTADPDLASWGATRIDLFVRGGNAGLYQSTWSSGSGWQQWVDLGGKILGGPAAVAWGPDRLDVFARGQNSALYHRGWTAANGWQPWESLGGWLTSDPDVASSAPGRLEIFARGGDQALWRLAWTGTAWTGWESLGGSLTSGPGATSWGTGRLHVFARGTDHGLIGRVWTSASGWEPWYSLEGRLISAPDAAAQGSGRLDVVTRGTDGDVWQRTWNAGWQPWFRVDDMPA